MATGWFARAAIPTYCISLTINFSEEERYLLRHSGIGHYVFFRAPIPPDVIDPDKIKKLKTEDFGLFFIRDLLGFGTDNDAQDRRLGKPHRKADQSKH